MPKGDSMRLYKMELYKLLYRKMFWISLAAVLGILTAYFTFVCVGEERTTIDGTLYTGLEAVSRDREITEEFKGILTDEKARRIIDQYGLPSQIEENYGGFHICCYCELSVLDGRCRLWLWRRGMHERNGADIVPC